MSLGDARLPEKKAKKEAEKNLRLTVGNLPHLGDSEMQNGEYVFPIMISVPRVIFEDTQEGPKPVEVKFLSESKVGEIHVDAQSGEINSRTDLRDIEDRIEEKKKEIERAVQKALIKSAADDLSLLSYPKHRNNPALEILSEIIISEQIELDKLRSFRSFEKYRNHLDTLEEAGLVSEEDGCIVAGDPLKYIEEDNGSPSERLNAALAYLFKTNADDLGFMSDFLGPYLKVAGYYYRRAIESDSLPEVTIEEFRRKMSKEEGREREFQVSRYLIELEQVGLLKISATDFGERAWVGDPSIKAEILQQEQQLSTIAEVRA